MKVHHDIAKLPGFKNAVITIGSYDGVHVGHRKIIKKVTTLANELNGESIVISFDPHPRQVIYPNDPNLVLLNTIEEKIELLRTLDIDHLVLVPFTIEFSQQLPLEYIENFIVKTFNPSAIVIGYDHRFGLNRDGNIDLLRLHGDEYKFEIIEIKKQEIDHNAISSSRIRLAIKEGNIGEANQLLGSNYRFTGRVIHGEKIGEFLGYPTANLNPVNTHKLTPCIGIYAVRIKIEDEVYDGMMYIGNKPTLEGSRGNSIEVNIFKFKDTLYGKDIEVEVIEYVREDKKFDSLEALKIGITADKAKVESILALSSDKKKVRDTAVVILNYNGSDHLETYLPPLVDYTEDDCEIVLIDNGSTDDSLEYIAEYYPEIKCIELDKNHGFAQGYNEGLKSIHNKFLILLNSDVRVSPEWISPLITRLKSSALIAAVQPKILSDEHTQSFEYAGAAGGLMDVLNYPYCYGRNMSGVEEDEGQYNDARQIFWASGAAIAIKGDLFKKIGGFDGSLFAHQEEIDLCWRLKRAGYQVWYEPKSSVYHLGGGTLEYDNPKKTFLNFRNNQTIILKNESAIQLLWKLPARFTLDMIAALRFLVQGSSANAISVGKAWVYIISHSLKIIKQGKEDKSRITSMSVDKYNRNGRTSKLILLDLLKRTPKT